MSTPCGVINIEKSFHDLTLENCAPLSGVYHVGPIHIQAIGPNRNKIKTCSTYGILIIDMHIFSKGHKTLIHLLMQYSFIKEEWGLPSLS